MPFFIEQLAHRHRKSPPSKSVVSRQAAYWFDPRKRLDIARSNYAHHAKTKLLLLAKSDLIYVNAVGDTMLPRGQKFDFLVEGEDAGQL
jgi:hypothetical protein